MKNSDQFLYLMMLAFLCCLLGAVDVTIDTPADGNGAVWDTNPVDGTTTDCANGSSVTGALYKKNGGNWVNIGPLVSHGYDCPTWRMVDHSGHDLGS